MANDRCERCGERRWVPIAYGYPGGEMFAAAERGEIELGGCVLIEGAPSRRCRVCGLAEGQYPWDWTGFDGPRTSEFAEFHSILSAVALDAVTADPGLLPEFALSFDGYAAFDDRELFRIAQKVEADFQASGKVPANLVALRCCLFAAQRGFHHRGETMEGPYVDAILAAIRRHL